MYNVTSQQLKMVAEELTAKHGLLMRHRQLADVIGTSPESLRNTMRRSKDPNIEYLRLQKRQIGRRVRYLVSGVAEAIVLSPSELEWRMYGSAKGGSEDG